MGVVEKAGSRGLGLRNENERKKERKKEEAGKY